MTSKNKFSPVILSVIIVSLVLGTALVFLSQSRSDETQPATIQPDSQPANQPDEPDHQPQTEPSKEVSAQPDSPTETIASPDKPEQEDVRNPEISQDAGSLLPDDWDELTPDQKTERNPYDCDLQTHYVRADNGRCLPAPEPSTAEAIPADNGEPAAETDWGVDVDWGGLFDNPNAAHKVTLSFNKPPQNVLLAGPFIEDANPLGVLAEEYFGRAVEEEFNGNCTQFFTKRGDGYVINNRWQSRTITLSKESGTRYAISHLVINDSFDTPLIEQGFDVRDKDWIIEVSKNIEKASARYAYCLVFTGDNRGWVKYLYVVAIP